MNWKSNTLKIPRKKAGLKHFHQLDQSQTWFFMQSQRQLWWHQHQNINIRLLGTAWTKSSIPNTTFLNHNQSCSSSNSLTSFFSPNWLLTLYPYSKAKPVSVAQPQESITGKLGKETHGLSSLDAFCSSVPSLFQLPPLLWSVTPHPTPLLLMSAALYVISADTGWHWKDHIPIALKNPKDQLFKIGTTRVLQVTHWATEYVFIWLDGLSWELVT